MFLFLIITTIANGLVSRYHGETAVRQKSFDDLKVAFFFFAMCIWAGSLVFDEIFKGR